MATPRTHAKKAITKYALPPRPPIRLPRNAEDQYLLARAQLIAVGGLLLADEISPGESPLDMTKTVEAAVRLMVNSVDTLDRLDLDGLIVAARRD